MSRSGPLMISAIAFAGLGGLAVGPAHAQGAVVSQSGGSVAESCAGGDATVNGNGNSITFGEACRTLMVNGSGNTIQIDLTSAGEITLNGTGNRIRYMSDVGAQDAAVADRGQGNTVMRIAEMPSGPPPFASNMIAPGGVPVQGPDGEMVQAGPGGVVVVPAPVMRPAMPAPGMGPVVTVAPGVVPPGPPDAVAPGSPAMPPGWSAAPVPGQLLLSGNAQNRDVGCGGENVYIRGDNGFFMLRGGCKALFIRGDDDVVHVEATPGAQIAIQGDNALAYVLMTGVGPGPTLLVTGQNSRAFLVRHIDDTEGTEIPASVQSGALQPPAYVAVGSRP
jgi:Protein of unknown function (DUF3060)